VQGYTFEFRELSQVQGPNYIADHAEFTVLRDHRVVSELITEKRFYTVQRTSMTEVGLDAGFTRDLYVALGEPLADSDAWAVRIYVKPLVRWIWLGAILMALGGALAMSDKRYRASRRTTVEGTA
ncbi:MAG TPA: cytochrome c-type biogenesis CcmF C-terminal domain-containing protein, partial [Pseudidiomarina sp.]|nr:cytochrome c-type biogenesis CcmF C-terminal domain-containing protein [Pseudidiomarina sp.]